MPVRHNHRSNIRQRVAGALRCLSMLTHLRPLGLALSILGLAGIGLAQAETETPWTPAPKSRVRIIAAGGLSKTGLSDAVYQIGIEISLEGKALTYWRTPGEAGIPPEFNFTRSDNLAQAAVSYPAPFRIDEAGGQAFGYQQSVIFPITIHPKDPAQAVPLKLDLHYAVCEKICIPVDVTLATELVPSQLISSHAEALAQARALVPVALTKGVTLVPLDKTHWRVTVAAELKGVGDMFAEAPEGWYFETKPSADQSFELVLLERPKNGSNIADPLVLTLVSSKGRYEITTHLDVGPASP